MIQVIDTGNVKTITNNGLRMFDIEFSYAVDGSQRERAEALLDAMVYAYNAQEINAAIEVGEAMNDARNDTKILRFSNDD